MKALQRDFFRELVKNKGRLISVFFIVLLGAAFFSGLRASKQDMLLSAEQYYDSSALMDFRILGTLGLTDADIEDMAALDEVEHAYGGYSADVLCIGESKKAIRLIGYCDKVNLPTVVSGRLPQTVDECFVDAAFMESGGYHIGDQITVASGNDNLLSKTVCRDTFTIVGSGSLPYYMDLSRGTGNVGNGQIDGFLLLMPEAFSLPAYTEAYVQMRGATAINSFDAAYTQKASDTKKQLESISALACQRRYDALYQDGAEQLKDAKAKLSDAVAKQEDARAHLADGEEKLSTAQIALDAKQRQWDQSDEQLKQKEADLSAAEQELAVKSAEFTEKKQQFLAKQQEAQDARSQLEAARPAYTEGKSTYEALAPQLTQTTAALPQITQSLADMEAAGQTDTSEYQALVQKKTDAETLLAQGASIKASLDSFEQKKQQLAAGERVLQQYAQQISEEESSLSAAELQLSSGRSQLTQAQTQLSDGKVQLDSARKEFENKKQELAQAKAKYKQQVQDAQPDLAEAKQKIADGEKTLSELSIPEWYVLGRDMISSYVSYQNDSDRISNLGKLLPVIFFLVAALVSLTAMTRMVEEQRQQIGTLKALGCDNRTIIFRYLGYAMLPTLSGGFLGVLIGEKVLPFAIMRTYSMLYTGLPGFVIPYDWQQGWIAILSGAICTGAATVFACFQIFRSKPAQLMRPEAPQSGKRVWIERIPFLWKHLSFTQKSTLRNLFRYKKRFFMTVIGVSGCMGLVLVGLGLHDSIMGISNKQFSELTHYQAYVSLSSDKGQNDDANLERQLASQFPSIDHLLILSKTVELQSDSGTQDAVLEIPQNSESLSSYFTYRDRMTQTAISFPTAGALISEKTAMALGVKVGDSIQIKNGDNALKTVTISGIYENYIGHYLFISPKIYKELYGTQPTYNQLLLRYDDTSAAHQEKIGSFLLNSEGVQGVTFTSDTIKWANDTLSSLNTIVSIILAAAGLLAFVVLYNLNSINIAERQRELATLKVLGFYDTEVASYVYKENILLTLIGTFFGIGLGIVLHQYVIRSIEVDMIMFGRSIFPISFIIGAVLSLTFSVLVNGMMYRTLKRVDMIQSLKSIE